AGCPAGPVSRAARLAIVRASALCAVSCIMVVPVLLLTALAPNLRAGLGFAAPDQVVDLSPGRRVSLLVPGATRHTNRVAQVLAVANQKGGVGKTTTVASLGAALAELGRRVLLVDLDPQACLTFAVGLDSGEVVLSAYDVLADGIPAIMAVRSTLDGPDLLPATIDLAACEALLAPVHGREQRLRTALAPLADRYDDVLVDCPPTLG